eukprot:6186023-Pleurochrysis_carterae.AAC.2
MHTRTRTRAGAALPPPRAHAHTLSTVCACFGPDPRHPLACAKRRRHKGGVHELVGQSHVDIQVPSTMRRDRTSRREDGLGARHEKTQVEDVRVGCGEVLRSGVGGCGMHFTHGTRCCESSRLDRRERGGAVPSDCRCLHPRSPSSILHARADEMELDKYGLFVQIHLI